jgi:dolichol-phosphate mannosyltransferase
MLISVVIPAYNEECGIADLLVKLKSETKKIQHIDFEYIVIDNGSQDSTYQIISKFYWAKKYRIAHNLGKGDAIRLGIKMSTGDFVLIQDADNEYDPADIYKLTLGICKKNIAILGSRVKLPKSIFEKINPFFGKPKGKDFATHLANRMLTFLYLLFYRKYINDSLTGYKLLPGKIVRKMAILTSGFETDHELLAKLIHAKCKLREIEISYHPRTKAEGKKINITDFFKAVETIVRFSFEYRK